MCVPGKCDVYSLNEAGVISYKLVCMTVKL